MSPVKEAARSGNTVPRTRALLLLAAGVAGVTGACVLAGRGLEPFATWLYIFAWYPLLLALEAGVALRTGRFFVLERPGAVASLLLWSVPVWMFYELLNFRVRNWYYVLVPAERPLAWLGIVVSFATVLPAVYLPAALTGLARRGSERAVVEGWTPWALRSVGLLFLALPLAWPRLFFPLIWGVLFFLAEATLCRRTPSASLWVDWMEGRWGRTLALLSGGALAGLFWESLNSLARARWIYTVPGLEGLKLFEMPPLGFLGFPVLALSVHAAYQWLVAQGVAIQVELPGWSVAGEAPSAEATRRGRLALLLAPVVVIGALVGMDRWTISSRDIQLRDLPGLLPAQVEDLRAWGVTSPWELARYDPVPLADAVPGVSVPEGRRWIEAARLATTRGIGARNARLLHAWGVRSLADLARAEAGVLASCFRSVGPPPVRAAQIRVWQRTAEALAGGSNEVSDGVRSFQVRCPEAAGER